MTRGWAGAFLPVMRTLWMVVVVVLLVGCGTAGMQGAQGNQGPQGPPGLGGMIPAGPDDQAIWTAGGGETNGNGVFVTEPLVGRGGMPTSARQAMVTIDACAGGELPLSGTQRDTIITIGSPAVTPESFRFTTAIDCVWNSTDQRPRNYLSEQITVNLDETQALGLGFREFSGFESSSMEYRLRLVAWVP